MTLVVLDNFCMPKSLNNQQTTLVQNILHKLISLAVSITSLASGWNNLVADMQLMSQRGGFNGNLPTIFMHKLTVLEWEVTLVDPNDCKGKKPTW
jgi:hypothetical protein